MKNNQKAPGSNSRNTGKKSVRRHIQNWLGHSRKAAVIDALLLTGASAELLAGVRPSFKEHLRHLERKLNITLKPVNGVYKFPQDLIW
jgi:hypothetical protein